MYIERNKKREEAAKKFQRFYRGKPAIEITEGETALKGNVREIVATIHKSGKDNPKTLVSKTLAQALKRYRKVRSSKYGYMLRDCLTMILFIIETPEHLTAII